MYYYQCKVTLKVEDPKTGKEKKHVEYYLVNGVSPTDAETKVHQKFENVMMDFEVDAINKSPVCDVIE